MVPPILQAGPRWRGTAHRPPRPICRGA